MGYYGEVNGMYSISEQTRDWREKVENEMDQAVKDIMGANGGKPGMSIREAAESILFEMEKIKLSKNQILYLKALHPLNIHLSLRLQLHLSILQICC